MHQLCVAAARYVATCSTSCMQCLALAASPASSSPRPAGIWAKGPAGPRHLLPATSVVQALEQLEGLPTNLPVPVGGCAVLAGIMLLVILDSTLAGLFTPEVCRNELQDGEINCVVIESKALKGALRCHGSSVAAPLSAAAAASMKSLRQAVTAITMEFGCIFHSVIIGIGVGAMTGDKHLVLTMITALAIHQGLEGLALGSVLALTSFSNIKKILMLFLYSITTPIGKCSCKSYSQQAAASKQIADVHPMHRSGRNSKCCCWKPELAECHPLHNRMTC